MLFTIFSSFVAAFLVLLIFCFAIGLFIVGLLGLFLVLFLISYILLKLFVGLSSWLGFKFF